MNNKIEEIKRLLKRPRPKGADRKIWQKHLESLRQQLYYLENNIKTETATSSKDYGKTFWKVSEKTIMRGSMGTAWGVSKTGVPARHATDWSKGQSVDRSKSHFPPK